MLNAETSLSLCSAPEGLGASAEAAEVVASKPVTVLAGSLCLVADKVSRPPRLFEASPFGVSLLNSFTVFNTSSHRLPESGLETKLSQKQKIKGRKTV